LTKYIVSYIHVCTQVILTRVKLFCRLLDQGQYAVTRYFHCQIILLVIYFGGIVES